MLPNAENSVVDQSKIQNYLLSSSHPSGQFKKSVFSSLGYTQENWQVLRDDLRKLGRTFEAYPRQSNAYGQKYTVSGKLVGSNGKSGDFVTVWIVDPVVLLPRFLTAYPG